MLRAELAYLFSHNPAKIDECLGLIKNMGYDFTVCLEAMKLYTIGSHEQSLERFQDYMRRINGIPDHFLACKMLGTLLMGKKQYKYAIPVLALAVERRPDDMEVHEKLIECYRNEGMEFEMGVESSIARLLACDSLGSIDTKAKGYAMLETE